MAKTDENLNPFAGVESIICGSAAPLYWLPAAVPVSVAETERWLVPEELAYAREMKASSRREEYLRTRYLLRRLTGWREPLPRTPFGGPSWPPGWTGSITHKDGHVGVALARADRAKSIGVDAEAVARVKEPFEPKILTAAESRILDRLEGDRVQWLAVAFAFKEALFKCHHPLGGVMFYFHDAEVLRLDPATGEIAAAVRMDTSPRTPAGAVAEGTFVWKDQDGKRLVIATTALA
jgi:enterobactin synthetase component D